LPPGPRTELGLLGKEPLFFLIDLALSRDEVNLFEGYHLGLENEFVAGPEEEESRDSDVGSNECVGLEGDECVITLEESDDAGGGEGKVCTPWLEWGFVGQIVTGIALNFEGLHESTVEGHFSERRPHENPERN